MEDTRIDKWLWAARFFKTRSLAAQAVDSGRVRLAGQRIKASRSVRLGEVYDIDNGSQQWEVRVRGVSDARAGASVAQQLYEETAASRQRRAMLAESQRWSPEPGAAIKGRPTKRDRRHLDDLG